MKANRQHSLTEFGSGGDEGHEEDDLLTEFERLRQGSVDPARITEVVDRLDEWELPRFDEGTYPSVSGYRYGLPEDKGPAEVVKLDRYSPKSHWNERYDHEDIPSESGIFLNGVGEFVRKFALTDLWFPKYYTKMDTVGTKFRWSCDYRTHVSHRLVRQAVRLANGKGRIDRDGTSLILCATGAIVATGPRGVFWVEIPRSTVRRRDSTPLPDPPASAVHEVRGVEVVEENPRLRTALGQLFEYTDCAALPTPEVHCGLTPSHEFQTQGGETVVVDENSLRLLHNSADGVHEILGPHETYTGGDDWTVTVTIDDIPGTVGEVVEVEDRYWDGQRDLLQEKNPVRGVVVGYRIDWREVSQGFGTGDVSKVIPRLETMVLQPDLSVEVATRALKTVEIGE